MKGENNQNLGQLLPMNEARMTKGRFIEYLKDSARLDPENFKLGNVVIEGEIGPKNWPVVVGEHSIKRLRERTYMVVDDILCKAISILSNPLIGTEVVKHAIFWDEDTREAVDFNGDGITATVVKLEAENMVFVFESGCEYIRLVTLWSGDVSKYATYNSAVVFVNKDGATSYPEQN